MTIDLNPKRLDILYQVQYGSKLYGTSTPTSDLDLKSVYLPPIRDVMLGKRLVATKDRRDADWNIVPEGESMPDNGIENEYIPFSVFVRDFVAGQTYAVEVAYAILAADPAEPTEQSRWEWSLVQEMVSRFGNTEVYSMVGFAAKQTLDYVHRGERLNEAQKVFDAVQKVNDDLVKVGEWYPRLDTSVDLTGTKALDVIVQLTGLGIDVVENNNKSLRALKLNGRQYLETTRLDHLLVQLKKLVESYGDRSKNAAEKEVDSKSLSHAVRVYQQAIEILDHGYLTFPRPNVEELLAIKQGKVPADAVKQLLKSLEVEVQEKLKTTTGRRKTPELVADAEEWLFATLLDLYGLQRSV